MIATVTLNPSLDEWIELAELKLGELNRASKFARYPGGKGINVSRVVHELGADTTAFALSGGEDGVILRQLMNRFSIRHEFVTVAGITRNNYKILTKKPALLTELSAPGPFVSVRDLTQLGARVARYAKKMSCIVFSGSLPPGASYDIYRRWVNQFRALGIKTVLDTSGKAFLHGINARPWLIKPNRQEAQELLGYSLSSATALKSAMRELLARGPSIVILSLGSDGAIMASDSPNGFLYAKPPRVNVVSAVGAGDSLVGGFLVGCGRFKSLSEALRLGVACGAATAITPGTELCHRKDVQRLFGRVVVRKFT